LRDHHEARVARIRPGRCLQSEALRWRRECPRHVLWRYARMHLSHDVAEGATIGSADPDFVPDCRVPQRDEHAATGVRVEVRVRPRARDRSSGKMEGEVLGGLLQYGIPLDVAFEDREIDAQARDLDA